MKSKSYFKFMSETDILFVVILGILPSIVE